MTERPHRPALFAGHEFASFEGSPDPASLTQLAHETARNLLTRVRSSETDVRDRAVRYVDANGIDAVAELWSRASAHSLPGALWRLYLLRDLIRQQSEHIAFAFTRGVAVSSTVDVFVAGAAVPSSPHEVSELADLILHGAFAGDVGDALDRAAAFCRLVCRGNIDIVADVERHDTDTAERLTTQAKRLSLMATEFGVCARLWRDENLD